MPLYATLEKIDRKLFEAAADLGATQWQTFIRVTIPLSMPGMKTGFFLVFVPSFGELVVPILMGGGKKLFVGSLITQYFLYARNPALGAAFTVISCLVLFGAVMLLYWYFSRKEVSATRARRI
jgi:spermidine/putrescine transport system permease protein